ncbi:FAD dependent oxidoreductase [Fodinibius roseus]|uniref:FAD dependent oxidoreductase n=2 Tax=Fodinibius roseus TaxID=1194090 RepID=A0A1M5F2S8_9BACT|nr:FAD-dependent oxidoreductase [Fodinibius roseus]SHF85786.1 FAD dependent oxidoreductase [Fodinibius roseus]
MMDRKDFLQLVTAAGTAAASGLGMMGPAGKGQGGADAAAAGQAMRADMVIAGGGLGGVAAALAGLRNGLSVILTEPTDWIGGQLTQQGVPPDEHQWIETHGAPRSYRRLRTGIRRYYRRHYPLTAEAADREHLNPGDGAVSRLCHEPRVALAVLRRMLAPYRSNGQLRLLLEHRATGADVEGDRVRGLQVLDGRSGICRVLEAPYFLDATELGDLLPLTGTEYVTGAESRAETGELHAPEQASAANQQAFTYCFAMDYVPGEDHIIAKPDRYDFWRRHVPDVSPPWPEKLLDLTYPNPSTLQPRELGFHPGGAATGQKLNLWNYRRIINPDNFVPGTYRGGMTVVNWPQNDYMLGNLIDVPEEVFNRHIRQSKQLSLSLLYWLQTEVPRPDGGRGWPGLRLRADVMGTGDGLAKYPYVRESRRIKAEFTVLEEHVGKEQRAMVTGQDQSEVTAADFYDSVGVGYYHIDLHPSSGGDNYIDFSSLPFQIPLGALLPRRMKNLLPAAKNIGTTHITNGCYRLHPVEWSIGEAAGLLARFALDREVPPRAVREERTLLEEFQQFVRSEGIETRWPEQGKEG